MAQSTRNGGTRKSSEFGTEIVDRLKLTNAINALDTNQNIRLNLNNW